MGFRKIYNFVLGFLCTNNEGWYHRNFISLFTYLIVFVFTIIHNSKKLKGNVPSFNIIDKHMFPYRNMLRSCHYNK